MTEHQLFMQGLDKQQPRWATQFASQQDLREYIKELESGDYRAMERLRYGVSLGLMVAVRAAIEAGIVVVPNSN
jgi:hypothetical protein